MNKSEKTQNNEKEMQKAMLEMNVLQNELSALDQQMQYIERYIQDLTALKNSVEELKTAEENQEFFSPLSQDIMIEAKIKNPKELLVNVGGKVLVKKSIDETKEIIEEKIQKTSELKEQTIKQIEMLLTEMDKIEARLREDPNYSEDLCEDENCGCGHTH